jgi:hypothetical protein
MELGEPSSYQALDPGTPVYSADGAAIGKVAHVLAVEAEDVFDGIVIGENVFGTEHRFADADDVERIYAQGVVLKLDRAACAELPVPSANPAVMHADPAEANRHHRLRRAWDRITGNS